jgi:hypothetical protein
VFERYYFRAAPAHLCQLKPHAQSFILTSIRSLPLSLSLSLSSPEVSQRDRARDERRRKRREQRERLNLIRSGGSNRASNASKSESSFSQHSDSGGSDRDDKNSGGGRSLLSGERVSLDVTPRSSADIPVTARQQRISDSIGRRYNKDRDGTKAADTSGKASDGKGTVGISAKARDSVNFHGLFNSSIASFDPRSSTLPPVIDEGDDDDRVRGKSVVGFGGDLTKVMNDKDARRSVNKLTKDEARAVREKERANAKARKQLEKEEKKKQAALKKEHKNNAKKMKKDKERETRERKASASKAWRAGSGDIGNAEK